MPVIDVTTSFRKNRRKVQLSHRKLVMEGRGEREALDMKTYRICWGTFIIIIIEILILVAVASVQNVRIYVISSVIDGNELTRGNCNAIQLVSYIATVV